MQITFRKIDDTRITLDLENITPRSTGRELIAEIDSGRYHELLGFPEGARLYMFDEGRRALADNDRSVETLARLEINILDLDLAEANARRRTIEKQAVATSRRLAVAASIRLDHSLQPTADLQPQITFRKFDGTRITLDLENITLRRCTGREFTTEINSGKYHARLGFPAGARLRMSGHGGATLDDNDEEGLVIGLGQVIIFAHRPRIETAAAAAPRGAAVPTPAAPELDDAPADHASSHLGRLLSRVAASAQGYCGIQ